LLSSLTIKKEQAGSTIKVDAPKINVSVTGL
jgi:hypothetical protein